MAVLLLLLLLLLSAHFYTGEHEKRGTASGRYDMGET